MTRYFAGENFLMLKKAIKGFVFVWVRVSVRKEKLFKREDVIYSRFFIFVISLFHFCIWNKERTQTDVAANLARCCYVSFQGKSIHKFIESENLSNFLVMKYQDESNVLIEFCQKQKPGFMVRLMWSAVCIVIKLWLNRD